MTATFDQINLRKAALLRATEVQRLRLAVYYFTLERPASAVTRVRNFLRNPVVLVGIGLCATRLPWRGLSQASRLAWKGWKWARIIRTISHFLPR